MSDDTQTDETPEPDVIRVKNIAHPERNLSLDGGPTIGLGEEGDAHDTPHTRGAIDEGHLIELPAKKTPAKTPSKD